MLIYFNVPAVRKLHLWMTMRLVFDYPPIIAPPRPLPTKFPFFRWHRTSRLTNLNAFPLDYSFVSVRILI